MKPLEHIPHALPGVRLGRQLSPGHAISTRCDGCLKWLSTIEGCTRYRGVLLHCSECTETRRNKHDAHVRLYKAVVLPLRTNTSTDVQDAHVQQRKAWVLAAVASRSEWVDGHLIWTGSTSKGLPRLQTEAHSYSVRRLYFAATVREPMDGEAIAPTCGNGLCLSCVNAAPSRIHAATIRTLDDLKAACDVDGDCGCWRWLGGKKASGEPAVYFIDPTTKVGLMTTGRRAALHLARGKAVPKGHRAWPRKNCVHDDCVNPQHSTSGTRKEHGKYLTRVGRVDFSAENVARLRDMASRRTVLSPEQAKVVHQRVKAGETQVAIARDFNVSVSLINKVANHKRACDVVLRASANSSVFAYAQAVGGDA